MAEFTVTTAADVVDAADGLLSLREAVSQANATAAADAIGFAAGVEGQTVSLTQGQLSLSQAVTIDGDGNDDGTGVTVSAGGQSRVFLIGGGIGVELADLTVADGRTADGDGGGITVGSDSSLTLANSHVTDCVAGDRFQTYQSGGAVFVDTNATIRVSGSTISRNSAGYGEGGGIACLGRAYVADSVIDGNRAGYGGGLFVGERGYLALTTSSVTGNFGFDYNNGRGGGIQVDGSATIGRSLIAGNSAAVGGGVQSNGSVTLSASTIAGNEATGSDNPGFGGGLSGSNLTVRSCTVTGNYCSGFSPYYGSGGGISSSSLRIYGSIVVGNFDRDGFNDVDGTVSRSDGRNLFGSGVAGSVPGDLENLEAAQVFAAVDGVTRGGRLALNGGPTQTVALRNAVDNPALGGAAPPFGDDVDQRGVARPQPGTTNPDIGAFELTQTAVSRAPSANNDVLTGTDAANTLAGLAGADLIAGGGGGDTLLGNDGSDTLRGDAGDDLLEGGFGSDWLDGGAGFDRISYFNDPIPLGVAVDLREFAGTATRGGETDRLFGIEAVDGGNSADTLRGDDSANRLGGAGGADRLYGEGGADVLTGGPGNDRLDGGPGRDLADFSRGGPVTVDLSLAADRATRGAEVDVLVGIEGAIGSGSADTFRGDAAANLFRGQGGKDTMTGSAGADSFDFDAVTQSAVGARRDVVTDFTPGSDELDLATIDARSTTPAVNDAFTFLAGQGAAFTAAGQVRWYQSGGDTFVEANVDANLAADMQVQLTGSKTLAAGDFLL